MVTINNPRIPGNAYLDQWISDGNIVFGCGQLERAPETGTPHLQMYVVTKENPSNKNGFGVKWMKENIHSTAHLDKREGTHEEARDYCTLPEYKGKPKEVLAGPWTVGEWSDTAGPSKGGKVNGSKILAVKKLIDEGAHEAELYQAHFGEMLRYQKNFERYRVAMRSKHRTWQTKSVVLWGPPKTGKSKEAWEVAIANFGEDDVYPLSLEEGTVWWDGYSGQKCVVVEEFYGQMKISYLLKLLDRYPLLVQTKGGMTPFVAEMMIFTSNEHPKMWYGKGVEPGAPSKIPLDVLRALDRRFEGSLGMIKELKEVFDGPDPEPSMADMYESMLGAVAASKEVAVVDLTKDDDEVECCEHSDTHVCDLCVDAALGNICGTCYREECICDDIADEIANEDDDATWQEYKEMAPANGGDMDDIPLSQAQVPRWQQPDVIADWLRLGDFYGTFKPQKIRRTDKDQASWMLETPKTSSGVYKKRGAEPVQATLSFKAPRRIIAGTPRDDDDDVDDKHQ